MDMRERRNTGKVYSEQQEQYIPDIFFLISYPVIIPSKIEQRILAAHPYPLFYNFKHLLPLLSYS